MALERPDAARNRRALLWGAPVVVLLLLYLLVRGSGSSPSSVDDNASAPGDLQAMRSPTDAPATYAPSVPTGATYAGNPAAAPPGASPTGSPPVQASADPGQLHLYGILSRGAVIGTADGIQHFVPIGRQVAPGVTLTGVDLHHAILSTPNGELRLALDAAPATPGVAVPPTPPPPAADTVVHLR